LLDASLHERSRFEIRRNPLEWHDAILIDER